MERKSKLLASNKKAFHDYFIEETFQAGIELLGMEVKSMRLGRFNLKDSYIEIKNGEAFINNMHISPYEQATLQKKEPLRQRRLLLNRREINKLHGALTKEGATIVPLRAYLLGQFIKLDIAIGKGKKLYDKRQSAAKKDLRRETERDFKIKNL